MMKRSDFERLILSFFIAVALFAAIAVAVHFLPLGSEPYPEYGGPMYVTFEEEDEPPPEPEPAVPPEEPPPEPETASSRESAREEDQAGAPSSETPDTAAESEVRKPEEPEAVDRKAAGTESDDTAGEGVPTIEDADTEPLPEQEAPQTAEGPGPESGEADEVPGPRGERQDDEVPREEERPGILGDLAELDQALARADEEAGEASGEEGEEGARNGNAREYGSPGSPIDIEALAAKRKPIHMPEPEIGSELAKNMPPNWEVVVSFTLPPSGSIEDLKIVRDSGNTEVDRIIRNTIRKWRFEPVSPEVGSVKVLARYRIRVR